MHLSKCSQSIDVSLFLRLWLFLPALKFLLRCNKGILSTYLKNWLKNGLSITFPTLTFLQKVVKLLNIQQFFDVIKNGKLYQYTYYRIDLW